MVVSLSATSSVRTFPTETCTPLPHAVHTTKQEVNKGSMGRACSELSQQQNRDKAEHRAYEGVHVQGYCRKSAASKRACPAAEPQKLMISV